MKNNLIRILQLAWPTLLGQIAVLGNSIIDTKMTASASNYDLAAIGLGSAVYVSVYVGLMGIIQALSPIIAQAFGAKDIPSIQSSVHQSYWLALLLSLVGMIILLNPSFLFLLSKPEIAVQTRTEQYLSWIAIGLPAALLFRVFYAINTALARPKIIMTIQLMMLLLKAPLNTLLMFGAGSWAGMGVVGCAASTCCLTWLAFFVFLLFAKQDSLYQSTQLIKITRPNFNVLWDIFKLGLPIGAIYFIDVTSFTLMIFLINRFGTEVTGAQQLVGNIAVIAYMIPLALSNATSTLVAQAIGAKETLKAQKTALQGIGLAVVIGAMTSCFIWFNRHTLIGLYGSTSFVTQFSLSMIGWMALYHFSDAVQVMLSFILRAYKITTSPMIIYGLILWGFGLPLGYLLAFSSSLTINGFWIASFISASLINIALVLLLFKKRILKLNSAVVFS